MATVVELLDSHVWTRIPRSWLSAAEGIWLAEHVGPQRYYLHTRCGGDLWRYHNGSGAGYLEFARARDATMFLLVWGDR